MILLTFRAGSSVLKIRVVKNRVFFSGGAFALKGQFFPEEAVFLLSKKKDLLKEFPDLEGKTDKEMREEAARRFRVKIESFNTEQEVAEYLEQDLGKQGFILISKENG
jgi:hypothetical protein